MTIVHNERTKLTAAALDRASTACLTVGALGPMVAGVYGLGVTANLKNRMFFALGSVLWFFAAAALPVMARHHLGRLR